MTHVRVETVLKTLAEPNRVAILTLLKEKELPATQIAARFTTTRSAVSQHLRVLTNAGLLNERRDGTKRLYSLRPEGLEGVRKLLDGFWDAKMQRLKTEVEKEARSRHAR